MNAFTRLFDRIARPRGRRQFEAASNVRRPWGSRPFGPNGAEALAAHGPIRDRARHAVANNAWAANGGAALETALIGAGITPASLHPDQATRRMLGERYTRWSENADADGLTDWPGMQAAAVRALIVDGEAFLQEILTRDGVKYRLIPAEQVDASLTRDLGDGRHIIGGVEFDAAGRRVAYYISPSRPTDLFAAYAAPVRVPADQIIHVMRPLGAGQVRGVSWLAPVLLRLGELDQLEDALLVAAKMQAMMAAFVVDQNGNATGTPFADGSQNGTNIDLSLEPGTVRFLPAGWDVKFSNPQQASQSVEFAGMQLRAVAAGLGVPEFLLTGDMRGANYSSMRSALVAFRQRVEQIQFHTLIPQLIRPVWQRVMTVDVLRGALSIPDYESRAADYHAAEFYPPAQPWVDPLKDIQAEALAIKTGLKSRRQAVAAQGYAIEALDAEIAADQQRESTLGISFGGNDAATSDPANAHESPQP